MFSILLILLILVMKSIFNLNGPGKELINGPGKELINGPGRFSVVNGPIKLIKLMALLSC